MPVIAGLFTGCETSLTNVVNNCGEGDFITREKVTLTDSGNNYSAKFSPDNKIVYSQENNMSYGIYLMNIDGSDKQLLIPDAGNPVWSPGGKRIAYISSGNLKSPQK